MLSKIKINQRAKKKTNSILVETVLLAKKTNPEIASALAVPTRQQSSVNLERINKSNASTVIVPGKVLSSGELSKKVSVYALGFSEKAKEKLKKAGCEFKTILEVLKSEKKLEGEIIR